MQAATTCIIFIHAFLWSLQASCYVQLAAPITDTSTHVQHPFGFSMLHVGHISNKSETWAFSHAAGEKLLQGQAQQPITETSNESWFSRLGNAFMSVLFGAFVLVPFSIAFLWINEGRNAKLESLISLASSEAQTIEAAQSNLNLDGYDGTLVHINDGEAKGIDPVTSKHFKDSVSIPKGCLRLRTVAESYQWQESSNSKTSKDNLGGGKTTKTTYDYKKGWFPMKIDSSHFKCNTGGAAASGSKQNTKHGSKGQPSASGSKQDEHQNKIDEDLAALLKEDDVFNETVKYGEHYWLPPEITAQLSTFQDASTKFGNTLNFKAKQSHTFELGSKKYYYCPPERPGRDPQIGDFRVKVEYVPDGPATILALQSDAKKHRGGHTFKPYRAISYGCCKGYTDQQLKDLRLAEADKDVLELYNQDKCLDWGPFFCLCCCCNLVLCCFSALTPPQIYSAWRGKKSKQECLKAEQSTGTAIKWLFRLLGWLLLWAGVTMVFAPLEVILDIFPFLGPYLGTGVSWVIGFVTFLMTMVIATLIVALAYLIYHPLTGLCYLSVVVALVVGITLLCDALSSGDTSASSALFQT